MSFQLVVHNLCLYLKKPHYYCDKNAKKTHDVFVQWQQVNAQHFSRDHIHSFLHSSRHPSLSLVFLHAHPSLYQPMLHTWLILQSLELSWFSNTGQCPQKPYLPLLVTFLRNANSNSSLGTLGVSIGMQNLQELHNIGVGVTNMLTRLHEADLQYAFAEPDH